MNGKFKDLVAAGLVLALTGCGSMDAIVKSNLDNAHKLSKKADGVVYGLVHGTNGDATGDAKKICEKFGGADDRCFISGERALYAMSAFGFSSAAAGSMVLVDPEVADFKPCGTPGGKGCFYAKFKVDPGKFGTLIALYKEGENGCHWAGMPRMGGVVCNDWDYRKDMRDWDTTNGVMTVKDN